MKLGASDYLCKPVDADDILAAFERSGSLVTPEIPQTPTSVERLEWTISNEHYKKIREIFLQRYGVWECTDAPYSANCKVSGKKLTFTLGTPSILHLRDH